MGAENAKHTQEEVWDVRRRCLTASLSERRTTYHCGSDYCSLENITKWPQYFSDVIKTSRRQTNLYPVNNNLNHKVRIWDGDVTRLEVECVVNSSYSGEGYKAISRGAGQMYQDECLYKGVPEPGQVKVMGGYFLPAKYVINTSPIDDTTDLVVMSKCYENSLEAAKSRGLTSIAFPCVRSKIHLAGYKKKPEAVHTILKTVRLWLEHNTDLVDTVVFCVATPGDTELYHDLIQLYFPLHVVDDSSDDDVTEIDDDVIETQMPLPSGQRYGFLDHNVLAGGYKSLDSWRNVTLYPLEVQPIHVNRSDKMPMLKQLYSLYDNPNVDLRKTPLISFEGEEGMDLGALSREYFFGTLQSLTQGQVGVSPAFEGDAGHRLPCASHVHNSHGVYEMTGKVIAHSKLHGGVGCVSLSPAIVYLLCHDVSKGDVDASGIPIGLDDVADVDIQILLTKADTLHLLDLPNRDVIHRDLLQVMERCNFGYMPVTKETLPVIRQEVILFEVVYKRWQQIEQIRLGLDSLGLYSFLCRHPTENNIKEVFPQPEQLDIDPQMLTSKVDCLQTDTEQYRQFLRLLKDIHNHVLDGISISDLLAFWTGHPMLPEGRLRVSVDPVALFPLAHCCFYKLYLPGATATYEDFREAFHTAVCGHARGAIGFDRT